MTEILAIGTLVLCALVGLVLIPLSLPGLWIMVLGVLGYGWLTDFRSVGVGMITAVVGLAFLGEIIEWWVSVRFTQRYGGSRQAAWGALVGGVVGAVVGVPVPVVGSVIGAFVGAFAGAVVFEYFTSRSAAVALNAGWGAVLGRAAAAAAKVAIGLAIAVLAVVAALRG